MRTVIHSPGLTTLSRSSAHSCPLIVGSRRFHILEALHNRVNFDQGYFRDLLLTPMR